MIKKVKELFAVVSRVELLENHVKALEKEIIDRHEPKYNKGDTVYFSLWYESVKAVVSRCDLEIYKKRYDNGYLSIKEIYHVIDKNNNIHEVDGLSLYGEKPEIDSNE